MIQPVKNKNHLVIKRDGSTEIYNKNKMYKVILWACEGSEVFANELLNAVDIKIHNKIHITKLYDEVINTASNLISDLYPFWDVVAKNLYNLKLHKDIGVKRTIYPYYSDVLSENAKYGFYRDEYSSIEGFTKLGLDYKKIANAINPAYDKLFTFGGLNLFVQKYCNHHKDKILELPQHVYMKVALQLMAKDGTDAVIAKYNQIASHTVTEATPKVVNALKPNASMFSCCLVRPSDSLEGIMESITMLTKESKFSGGDAWDVSLIRAPGAVVEGNKGTSSGVVPYVKALETAISGFNQGNTRSSACICTFDSFHYESPEIAELKLETGKDEDRARKLQYSVKWRNKLSTAIKKNEDIYLIDPHKTQDLFESYGVEWDKLYKKYSNNTRIHKRKYKARDLGHTIVSNSADTGNMYYTLIDNLNTQDISGQYIPASNLCQEMAMNYDPITQVKSELTGTNSQFTFDGDIALCNLLAVNLIKWVSFTDKQKEEEMYLMVKSADNAIDTSFYVNPLGEQHSKKWRNLAIGVSNYANVLASNKAMWDSEKARKLTHELFEELQFYAIKASIQLAKVKSRFEKFDTTLWNKGIFPHELSILGKLDSKLNYPLLQDWESLRSELIKYGIRNCRLIGLMPTSTSGKCINATEGVDPIRKFKTIQEGTYSLPFVVPNLKENRTYYQTTFEVDNKDTIELSAIRQKFVCMSQSTSLGYKKADSSYEMIKNIMYAEELGLKTIYYTHTQNAEDREPEICEACG